jgi:hypothetical protein
MTPTSASGEVILVSSLSTQRTPTTFHSFKKLPMELRLKIWGLTLSNASRVVLVQVRAKDRKPFCLTYQSLRPLNICQEERQEKMRCFKLKIQGRESVEISKFTAWDVSSFNVSRDIAYFESATNLATVCACPWNRPKELGLDLIRYMAFKEVVTPVPSSEPGSPSSNFGNLRRILTGSRYLMFPALKSLVVMRLCHKNKAPKLPGQKKGEHRLLNGNEIEIVIKELDIIYNEKCYPAWKPAVVTILSHGRKIIRHQPIPTKKLRK